MSVRYYVDLRAGCVAVRDKTKTDRDYQGLHADTQGVVFYRHGEIGKWTCPTCKHTRANGFKVDPEDVAAAHEECCRLNRGN